MGPGARWARTLLIAVTGTLACASAAAADDAPRYRLVDLGPTTLQPRGIGDDGTVVGTTSSGAVPGVWHDGRFIPLPLGGHQTCEARDMNATGLMGGFCSSASKTYGATWQMMSDGTIQGPVILPGIGHPSYTFAVVYSVASDGTLGGEAGEPNPNLPSGSGAAPWRRAVVWRAGDNAIRRLDATTFGNSENASVTGVNARRMAVGRTGVNVITGRSWALNPDATPASRADTDIDIAAGLAAHPLNDAGTSIGVRLPQRTNGVIRHVDGTTIDTGTFRPTAINQAGATVGLQAGKAAFRSLDGVVQDLSALLGDAAAGWTFTDAADLNERGDIVGLGKLNGVTRGFLLQRVPDGLKASVDAAGPPAGDTFGIAINAINTNADPLTALTFPSGMGVARDDSAGGAPIGLQALAAPAPAWPATLAPGATGGALAAFEVTAPGTTRLVARVTGKDPSGHVQSATASLRVTAELRPMTPWEARQSTAGAFALVVDQLREARRKALTKAVDRMRKTLTKSKRPGAKTLLKATRFEKALAQSQGLPPQTLSILSAALKDRRDREIVPAKASRTELAMIFAERSETAFLKQVEKSVNSVSDKVIETPFMFWRDYARGLYNGQEAAINAEIADAAGEVYTKGSGLLAESRAFWGSEAERTAAWTELPKIYDETAKKVAELEEVSEQKILKWDQAMTKDPRKGVAQFADMLGNVEGQVVGGAIEDVFAPQELMSKTLSVLKRGKKAGDLEDVVDAVVPPGATTTERLAESGATLVTRNGDVARTPIPTMGNLNPDQLDFLSSTVKKLNQKFGVRGEIQVRPINGYSANIRDGIGKVEAVPTKNLTPDDVLMGAPEAWLGQTAYYKPKRPTGLGKLADADRQRIELRYEEKLDEYKKFKGLIDDESGKAAKVKKMLKPGGAEVELGQNYKAKIELTAIEKDGATLIQYKKLAVNGTPVFKGKPRPIVSDADFHAVVDSATGRNLPASVRAQYELELMNEFSKAQRSGLLPFGFHGWTHSGFDVTSKDFRLVSKYLLMYASEAQARRYAHHWGPRFFPELGKAAAVDKVLAGYTRGKHLVRVSAEGASFGLGVDPTVGLPLP